MWYFEHYLRTSKKAESYRLIPDGAAALAYARASRGAMPDEILRVLAPARATAVELQQLRDLGARPF